MRARNPQLEIVPMQAADIDALMEVERLCFKRPWPRQLFVEELGREWAHLDVLKQRVGRKTMVVGFCNFWLVRDELHILNVAVHPDHRRQGLAKRLLEHMLAFAQRHRVRYLTLEVRRSNTGAQALYEQFEFRPIGVRRQYYVEDREDAIVMLRELPQGETVS